MKEIDVMIRPDPLNEKFEAKISCVFARLSRVRCGQYFITT